MAAAAHGQGAHWFYLRRERWEPFGELENSELEDAHAGGRDRVEFGAGRYPAVLSQRLQYNHDVGSQRAILRGTWFFQRSDGTMCPYPEDVAAKLELGFDEASPADAAHGVPVDDQRTVYRAAAAGAFVQVHQGSHKTRWVSVQFKPGALPIEELTALKDAEPPKPCIDALTLENAATWRLVQWWCQRDGSWQPYNDHDNDVLERAYFPPQRVQVPVRGGAAVVDVIGATEHASDGAVYPVLRAKWHVQRTSGELAPFNKTDNARLEESLVRVPVEAVTNHEFHAVLRQLRAKGLGKSADWNLGSVPFFDSQANAFAWHWYVCV